MRPHIRQVTTATLSAALLLGSLANCGMAPEPHSAPTPKGKFAEPLTDFNGDGYGDIAISATGTTVGGKKDAGAIVVTYGGARGLDAAHRTVLTESTAGIPGAPRANGAFGYRTTAGDLDRDGYTDLVVAARLPFSRVTVVWGGAQGLTGGTAVPRPAGDPVDKDHLTYFGQGLAIGDFNGDHTPELAVVTADYALERQRIWVYEAGIPRTGAVREPYGRKFAASYDDVWGASAGDLNGDGTSDLVVRTYLTDSPGGGSSNVFYAGSSEGLPEGRMLRSGNRFVEGESQAIGDVNGDGYGDLAVGNATGGWGGSGCVTIVYGSPKGFGKGRPDQDLDRKSPGVPGSAKGSSPSDVAFGSAVALGDIDGDGYADLATGVTVLRGSAKGITTTSARSLARDAPGVGALFGSATALTDIDKDGKADLVVSAPEADSGRGAVWSLRGTAEGLTTTGALLLGPTDLGLPDQDTGLGEPLTG